MAHQYFENNNDLKSEVRKNEFYFKGVKLSFYSDNGVFSKNGIDYGSQALLQNLVIRDNLKILDVGCGYGTIGVTVAKCNPTCSIEMVDVNERALGLCQKAIEENATPNAKCYKSDVYENVVNSFDMIISNPPIRAGKKVVHDIIINAYNHLNDGGEMWCVIQKKQGAPSAFKALKDVYSTVEVVANDKGYWIIKAIKSEKIA